MDIITKFTVASQQGLSDLLQLTKELAKEKFSALLEQTLIDEYIKQHFNEQTLLDELNSMSNQWLVVYVNDITAGYAKISSKGKKPAMLEGRRSIRIADFGVLHTYSTPAVVDSLLKKSLAVCKPYAAIWLNEHKNYPMLELFEQNGFVRQPAIYEHDDLPLPTVYLTLIK